jgi:hypothetical protein
MLGLGHSPKDVDWQCALLCSEISCLPDHFVVSVKLLLNVIVPASDGLKRHYRLRLPFCGHLGRNYQLLTDQSELHEQALMCSERTSLEFRNSVAFAKLVMFLLLLFVPAFAESSIIDRN